ncbi:MULTISPECIES: outer membrane-stress sensor serine endopeptidase DegS [Shewanella]|jgi:serine protease DegS|uniref:Periplasmic serine protease DegS n=3 Tax=Shewanella TaxID=22 RepID=A9L108_SHEB9|nr:MULTISPECIES: outer membrane-stress sensor serine endopeptidase DegS [Shewanella]EGT3627707.1 outer membrane-stress sensor serine endopeptidase DegS [Morganella morganii]QYX65405.1 outer membrane-stress sensor serine endopeptidase DegS [Shewanella putrefaciens]ABN63130.1 DegS. Serine peptidase. MEROPS family S01B [Shewanella baltica OS155]ABX47907.1 periplasmic serine protease DegS [Shewanella baltica OS195]ACK45239.1 periplasmic serine protease DegS [Shewanella baltica OS223]
MTIKDTLLYLGKATLFGLIMAAMFLLVTRYFDNQSLGNSLLQTRANNTVELSFAKAVRRAAPAVVNIYSLSIDQNRPLNSGSLQGLGSGVIMSKEGYILTNYHVIKKADEIVVALQDGRKFTSEVVGFDPETDLSVLKIEGDNLPIVPVNLDSPPQVGDVVLAIGNPYNLGQTITQGIISATGRNGLSSGYLDFLQTDAAINAGNSGGALIDTNGSLIGINTAAFQVGEEGGGHGINFAIPIKLAHSIMGKLIKNGRVIRGALGISGEPINPVVAQILNLPDLKGVLVTGVDPNGPAARALLMPRDVIIKYDGEDVPGVEMLMDRIAETTPGKKVMMTVIRQGKQQELPVIIDEKVVVDN